MFVWSSEKYWEEVGNKGIFVFIFLGQRSAYYTRLLSLCLSQISPLHDDVFKWKHFPRYWLFVRGIHRSPVISLHKGQWCGALMFSLIFVWINGRANNRNADYLRRYRAHYDVILMVLRNDGVYPAYVALYCSLTWPAGGNRDDRSSYGVPSVTRSQLVTLSYGKPTNQLINMLLYTKHVSLFNNMLRHFGQTYIEDL